MNKQELRKDLDLVLNQLETVYDSIDLLEKVIETVSVIKTELSKAKTVSKKPAVKTAVKTAVKAPKTAQSSHKSWHKFSLDNLPKAYTFMKVSFKDATKSQYGRFLHTSLTKDKHIYIDMIDNKKNTIRIPFQNIKQVYEYR